MYWVPLILVSAVGLGLYDVCKKHAVHENAVMPVLFLATTAGTAAFTLVALLTGQLAAAVHVSMADWWRLFIKALIVGSSWTFVYYGMRALPISIAAPIRASQPVWTVLGAYLCFHELPVNLQWLGMAAVFAGFFLFSVLGRREGIHFDRPGGVWCMLAGTLLGAVSALYDKYLLQPCKLSPETVQFWFSLDLVVLTGIALLIQRRTGLNRTAFRWRWSIPCVGIVLVAADWLYFTALSQPDTKIFILSLVRRSNVVISFTIGGALFQDVNRHQKLVALVFILLGVALLCLAK